MHMAPEEAHTTFLKKRRMKDRKTISCFLIEPSSYLLGTKQLSVRKTHHTLSLPQPKRALATKIERRAPFQIDAACTTNTSTTPTSILCIYIITSLHLQQLSIA